MQNIETIKSKGQATFSNLVDRVQDQPEDVKMWGITAATAVVGAVTVTAVAKGVLAILATIANPPVALTVGAIGGGALGWSYMQNQAQSSAAEQESNMDVGLVQGSTEPVVASAPETVAAAVTDAVSGSNAATGTETDTGNA